MSQYKDPFYNMTYSVAGVTQSHEQPQPASQVSFVSHLNEQSLQAIRKIVREEVEQALGLASNEQRMFDKVWEQMGLPLPHGVTYRGYSLQELDKVIDFYLNKGGK